MKRTPRKGDGKKPDKPRKSAIKKGKNAEAARKDAERWLKTLDNHLDGDDLGFDLSHTRAVGSTDDLPEVRIGPYDDWISLPNIKVEPFRDTESTVPEVMISEPMDDSALHLAAHLSICAGRSVSTYPPGMGDPICDYLQAELFERRSLLCLADGCSWGAKPREAARKATQAYMSYMKEQQCAIRDVREAGRLIFRAFSKAHEKIVEGHKDIWAAGTTTLCGGIFLELDNKDEDTVNKVKQLTDILRVSDTTDAFASQFKHDDRLNREGSSIKNVNVKPRREPPTGPPSWIFVCGSVGDCKAYHYSPTTQRFYDMTCGNRKNVSDAKDPGGRLGPYVGSGEPDLRNLGLYIMPCHPGDMVMIVSDGVHDNLDPQTLGIPPREFGMDHAKWEEAEEEDLERATEAKTNFALDYMLHLCTADNGEINPSTVAQRLTDHGLAITRPSRTFMEENPSKNLPHDYVTYPGKMDHTTAITGLAGGLTLIRATSGGTAHAAGSSTEYGSLRIHASKSLDGIPERGAGTHYGRLASGENGGMEKRGALTHIGVYDMARTQLAVLSVSPGDRIIELIKKIRHKLHDIIEGRAFRLRKGDSSWSTRPPAVKKEHFALRAQDFFAHDNIIVVQFAPRESITNSSKT